MSTISTPVCRPGAIGTRRCATVAGSTRAMRMAMVSAKSTSTRWRGRGPCYAPGCGHTGASRRRSCRCISASSSSCTMPDAEAKLSLAPSSRLWSCDLPPSPRNPTRAFEIYTRTHVRRPALAGSASLRALLAGIALIELSRLVLACVLEPWPIPIRTLDALHLATVEYLRRDGEAVELATYDN